MLPTKNWEKNTLKIIENKNQTFQSVQGVKDYTDIEEGHWI